LAVSDLYANAEASLKAGERLFSVAENGDLEELWTIFSDGAEVWHNTDDKLTSVEQSIKNLRAIRAAADEFRYVDIRREPTPTGFVQQHVLLVKMKDGREIRDMCCCVCRVENGRIAHMDAYHDSAATPPIPGRKPGRDWRHEA
jgi:ketosteroid isomerase-like protein